MATLLGNAYIRVRPDMSGFEQETKRGVSSAVKTAAKVAATAVTAAATYGAVSLVTGSVKAASELEQAYGGLDAVFKSNSEAMKENAKAASEIGLSQSQYANSATVLGAMLGNLGIDQSKLAGTTDDLISKGADLSAMFGGTAPEAVEAITAALRGERDPIERYGISLTEAGIQAEMAATGLGKAEATISLINKQMASSNAAGAAAREFDTFASAQQRLSANLENTKASLGEAFLPIIADVTAKFSDLAQRYGPMLAEKVKEIGQNFREAGAWIGENVVPVLQNVAKWLGDNRDIIIPTAAALGAMLAAFKAYKVIATAVTAVQIALNVAMAANPIGLIALAIAGLVAAFVALYQRNEGFRNFIQGVWQGIKDFMEPIIRWFAETIPPIWDAIFSAVSTAMSGIWNVITTVWDFIYPFVSGYLQLLFKAFTTLWGTIFRVVAGAMEGIWNVIKTVWDFIYPFVSGYLSMMWTVYSTIFQAVWTVISTVMNAIWAVISAIWGVIGPFITGVLKEIWNNTQSIWNMMWQIISSVLGWIWDKVQWAFNLVKSHIQNVMDTVRWIWDNILSGIWNKAVEIFDLVTGKIGDAMEKVKSLFSGAVDAIGGIWNKVTEVVKAPINSMFDWINRNMVGPINSVIDKFAPSLKLPELPTAFADGGYVSGPGGPRDDRIPARLSNGEYVVNAASTSKYRPLLEAINAAKLGFGIGGPSVEAQILGWLKGQGMSNAGIAGILGNLQAESGMNPGAVEGGNGEGHGLLQWSFSRKADLLAFAQQRGTSWQDLGTQLSFLARELTAYPSMWNQLLTASDPRVASQLFSNTFVRPGIYGPRDDYAASFFQAMQSGSLTPDSGESLFDKVLGAGRSLIRSAIEAVANPALGALEDSFGGSWATDFVIGGMRKAVDAVLSWADVEDAASAAAVGMLGYDGPGSGTWKRPVAGVVTSEYGPRGGTLHAGIDIGAPSGQPVFSAAAGKVMQAALGWNGGYGNMVQLDHGAGWGSIYAHLSAVGVKTGQIVRDMHMIGRVGSTGDSTGPHLHFEVLQNGAKINPRSMVQFDSGGMLQPGWSAVYNGTGKPEPVFSDKQWKALSGGHGGPVVNVTNYYPQAEPTSVSTARALRILAATGVM